MVKLVIDLPKIVQNFTFIHDLSERNGLDLVTVAKLCLTNIDIVKPIIDAGATTIGETNLVNLANLPYTVKKMLLRTSSSDIRQGLDGCDYVLVSELGLIEELASTNLKAKRGIFISVELGDLRDGVCFEELPRFVERALKIRGIKIEGIAANFGCLRGMIPDRSTLDEIEEGVERVRKRAGFTIAKISLGGTAIFDLIEDGSLAGRVNQIRIGEAIFFGHNMSLLKDINGLHRDAMLLSGEVIEIKEKRVTDIDATGYNAFGHRTKGGKPGIRKRAVLNFGELAAPTRSLTPMVEGAEFAGATHDYAVLDVTESQVSLSLGDRVYFRMNYNSAAQAIMSPYVEKEIRVATGDEPARGE